MLRQYVDAFAAERVSNIFRRFPDAYEVQPALPETLRSAALEKVHDHLVASLLKGTVGLNTGGQNG